MAAIVRYVNVNSAPGGDGTTDAILGVNRAYSSQNEMEAAEQSNLVADGNTFTGICAGGADPSTVTYSGWTTDATHDIVVTTTTDRHSGVFDPSKYYISAGTGQTPYITISEEYVSLSGLQFERSTPATANADRRTVFWTSFGFGRQIVNSCIFKSISTGIVGQVSALSISDNSPEYLLTNNIFYDFDGVNDSAITGLSGSPDVKLYNNTFINNSTAVISKPTYLIKNNIFQDNINDITGSINASNNYNLTDNATIGGANSVTSSTLAFEDKASFNFALVVGDTDAIGAGIGPSADSNVPTSDVIGTSRTGATTDIGAFVFVGAGGVTVDVTEGGPSFAESINTTLSVNIVSNISESGPKFIESIVADTSSLVLQASILESGPSFTESIAAQLAETLAINVNISEQGPAFAEVVSVNLDVNIASEITELGPSFVEAINLNIKGDRLTSIVELGPGFIESTTVHIPITITLNPKNIIRVKRKNNTVTIKRKSNTIRVR